MKLSAAFIVEQLKKNYDVPDPNGFSTNPCLIRPSFVFPDMKLEDYTVYVADEASLNIFEPYGGIPEHCLAVVSGSKTNLKASNICFLNESHSPLTIFSKIQKIFETYDNWQENLFDAYLKGKTINELLSISLPIFNNSLTVVGMDFTIVASAYALPNRREDIFGSSEATLSVVTDLKNNELYYKVRELDGAFYFPSYMPGMASLCVNMKQHGKTTYRLLMLEDSRPIKKHEGFLLEFLALIIQHILNHNLVESFSSNNKVIYEILESVLTNKLADYVDVSNKLNNEGWLPSHEYVCVYLELTNLDKKNETYNPIISYMNNIFSNCCAIFYNGNVVNYVNMTLSKICTDELIERIRDFTYDNNLCAGISRKMTGHMSLRRQYKQALNAATIGSSKSPQKLIHYFNDISFDYILLQSTRSLPGYMVCHEKLLLLKHNDKTKGTEYMNTLKTFLDNRCNVLQTANKLFIHRSTMLYRLEKIKEILDSDLKDPDELLYLMLSFRLIDLEEAKNNL